MGFYRVIRFHSKIMIMVFALVANALTACQTRSVSHSAQPAALPPSMGSILELNQPSIVGATVAGRSRNLSRSAMIALTSNAKSAIEEQQARVKQGLVQKAGLKINTSRTTKQIGATATESLSTLVNAIVLYDVSPEQAQAMLDQHPELKKDVLKVHRNPIVHAILDVSVPQIKANQLWTSRSPSGVPLDGTGMRIGIIDSGVDYRHADLGGCFGAGCKVEGGYDFIGHDADPMDENGHGTHVAATAAGRGSLNGVAPGAKIYAYRVLDAQGSGGSDGILSALERCADPNQNGNLSQHLDVCSLSLGSDNGNPDDLLSRAVDNAVAQGVSVTVAAGNSGQTTGLIGSPATARSAITVAASCKTAQIGTDSYCSTPIAAFSSYGPVVWRDSRGNVQTLSKPDVSAPGHRINAAAFGTRNGHVMESGTSMSTPHVAGAAALLRQAFPRLTPLQVKDILMRSARNLGVDHDHQGTGEINMVDAIALAGNSGAPTPTPAPPAMTPTPMPTATPIAATPTPAPTATPVPTVPGNMKVAMTSPANGSTFAPGTTITITAEASVSNGRVAQVQFIVNNQVLCYSLAPFTCDWQLSTVVGTRYSIVPRAFDDAGNFTDGSAIEITVSNEGDEQAGNPPGTPPDPAPTCAPPANPVPAPNPNPIPDSDKNEN